MPDLFVFPEQIAIPPDGRTTVQCAGIYDDAQLEGLSRVCRILKDMGGVPLIQLGHTGRNGSERRLWLGRVQWPPDDPEGWHVKGPSSIPYGGNGRPPHLLREAGHYKNGSASSATRPGRCSK